MAMPQQQTMQQQMARPQQQAMPQQPAMQAYTLAAESSHPPQQGPDFPSAQELQRLLSLREHLRLAGFLHLVPALGTGVPPPPPISPSACWSPSVGVGPPPPYDTGSHSLLEVDADPPPPYDCTGQDFALEMASPLTQGSLPEDRHLGLCPPPTGSGQLPQLEPPTAQVPPSSPTTRTPTQGGDPPEGATPFAWNSAPPYHIFRVPPPRGRPTVGMGLSGAWREPWRGDGCWRPPRPGLGSCHTHPPHPRKACLNRSPPGGTPLGLNFWRGAELGPTLGENSSPKHWPDALGRSWRDGKAGGAALT